MLPPRGARLRLQRSDDSPSAPSDHHCSRSFSRSTRAPWLLASVCRGASFSVPRGNRAQTTPRVSSLRCATWSVCKSYLSSFRITEHLVRSLSCLGHDHRGCAPSYRKISKEVPICCPSKNNRSVKGKITLTLGKEAVFKGDHRTGGCERREIPPPKYKDKWGFTAKEQGGGQWAENFEEETLG